MPRGRSTTTTTRTRRRTSTRGRSDAGSVVGQITQLVAANETLKHENAELLAVNEQLRAQLAEIGTALGSLTNGSRRRGRRGAPQSFLLADVKPKRQRRRITDPEQLERRRQALVKARAARAAKIAAAGRAASE
jgi:single-stranded DNA-specific DHH superfamily exonuclease